ncbi:MAG TPA: molybdenum cofactor synthesis domain-containing protein, partial [Candidatus Thermoplasmatota archaeon]|nr:molybdenum cofactor synthesis domain-containing protein [Candidatus Thermoplasmatota archaeon]
VEEAVRDEADAIQAAARDALARADVVVLTGVAPRDVTPEALRPLIEKELPGFGEAFRMLSFQEVGAAAIASRALMGVRGGRLLVALPGSPDACRLALTRLVLPEAAHLVSQARRAA